MAELLAARGMQGDGMSVFDVLYALDRWTWAQVVAEVAYLLALAQEELVSPEERATLEGKQALVGVVNESR
jgi:hypothetical protein